MPHRLVRERIEPDAMAPGVRSQLQRRGLGAISNTLWTSMGHFGPNQHRKFLIHLSCCASLGSASNCNDLEFLRQIGVLVVSPVSSVVTTGTIPVRRLR